MIIKKSDLQFVTELVAATDDFDFNGDTDSKMMTNLLFDKLKDLKVIGLTANQVGVNQRVFVIGMEDTKLVFFNPKINSYSEDTITLPEGTAMYPGIHVQVKRPESIDVTFQDMDGKVINTKLSGITARIFQHNFDNLNGLTLKDTVSKLKWDTAAKRYKNKKTKFIKQQVQKKLVEIQKEVQAQNGNHT